MKQLISLLTALMLFIWILPLGVFIKPSQEKSACGGLRAVCMCHHADAGVMNIPVQGAGFKASVTTHHEPLTSGTSAGNYFLLTDAPAIERLNISFIDRNLYFYYRNPSLKLLDHVPLA